jgi:nucleotide-binding universal stress UspA family protein
MDTIVVGIDDSDGARRALRWALELAKTTGATIEAVHVFPRYFSWIDGDLSTADLERSREGAMGAGRRDLDRVLAGTVGDRTDVKVTATVLLGEPAPTLVEHAVGADLLVVGSRGRGGLAGLLLGSVGRRCTEASSCPVVVVPDRAERV